MHACMRHAEHGGLSYLRGDARAFDVDGGQCPVPGSSHEPFADKLGDFSTAARSDTGHRHPDRVWDAGADRYGAMVATTIVTP